MAYARSGGSSGMSMNIMMIVCAVILAVVVVKWDAICAYVKQKELATDNQPKVVTQVLVLGDDPTAGRKKEPAPRPVAPAKKEPVAKTEPAPAQPKEVAGQDDAKAMAVISEADKLISAGNFTQAAERLSPIGSLKLGPEVDTAAKEKKALAAFLVKTEADNQPSLESSTKDLYDISLRNGDKLQAVVQGEEKGSLLVVKADGSKTRIPVADVLEKQPVKEDVKLDELRRELANRKALAKEDGVSYWKLACFALRCRLRPEALELLQAAQSYDKNLPAAVREEDALQLLKSAIYYQTIGITAQSKSKFDLLQKNFGNTKAAKTAEELLAEAKSSDGSLLASSDLGANADSAPVSAPASVQPAPAASKEPLDAEKPTAFQPPKVKSTAGVVAQQAVDAHYKGMNLYGRGAVNGNLSEGRRQIEEAKECLAQAIKLYEDALKKDPGNATLKKGIEDCTRKLFWAKKFVKLI